MDVAHLPGQVREMKHVSGHQKKKIKHELNKRQECYPTKILNIKRRQSIMSAANSLNFGQ